MPSVLPALVLAGGQIDRIFAIEREWDVGIDMHLDMTDVVLLDALDAADAVVELAQPLWGMKGDRMSFTRPRTTLYPPHADAPVRSAKPTCPAVMGQPMSA